ncbi:MAG: exo-alpha-sialidase [Lachnospiraceae bacterium]|nr:exo-alpha-sialidase [Lachnospiraceae bacterium]
MTILENSLIHELPPLPGNPRNSEGDFLRLKGGRILYAYSRYGGNSLSDDAPCDIAGLISLDHGESFSALPELLVKAADHGVKNVMSVSMVRLQSGEAVIFYLCKYEKGTNIFLRRIREARDSASEKAFSEGFSLSDPELVYEGRNQAYLVMNNSRVLVKRDGSLILPVAVHQLIMEADGHTHGEYRGEAVFIQGDRDARAFHVLSGPHALTPIGHSRTGLQEPCITELPDGRLQALYRTDLMSQYESFSEDGGRSFSPPLPSRFTSPDSPIEIAENPYVQSTGDGFRFLAVWNPVPNYNGRLKPGSPWITAGRTPLVAAASSDGLAYGEPLVIEDDPDRGFCYPAVFFTGPDTFLLAYCAGNAADGNCLAGLRIRKIRIQ